MKLAQTFSKTAKQVGGAHLTVHNRMAIMNRMAHHLKSLNIQIKGIEHLKTKHIQSYIQSRLAQGICKRTLHNEMAAIRQTLRQAGRHKLADSDALTNKALGLAGASRAGSKEATPQELYETVLQKAQAKDEGLAAAIQLARMLGLRSEEAVQCCQSLQTWRKELQQGKDHVTVVFGTKGGRIRQTRVLDREELTQVIENAIHITHQRNGKLIDKPTLKQAKTYWRNQTRRLGLTGKHSPHSLRYAWSQEATKHYKENNYTEEESYALTSMDMGHGDGRGKYVKKVYNLLEY